MLKFTASLEGNRTLLGIGLSDCNVSRLRAGVPILVRGESVHLDPFDLLILWGRTEEDLVQSVKEDLGLEVGPETIVHVDPKLGEDDPGDPPIGATGEFSDGKLCANDEGNLRFKLAADYTHGNIVFEFGKPVAWMGFTPELADQLAGQLTDLAKRVRAKGVQ